MNETNQPDKAKKKTMITIAILAAVVIVAILVIVFVNKKTDNVTPSEQTGGQDSIVSENGEEITTNEEEETIARYLEGEGEVPEVLKEARIIAPGTNLVTKDNIVVTDTGEPVKMNIDTASSESPKESGNLSEEDIPDDEYTVRLYVDGDGFKPNTFTVSAGQRVNFVLTSTNDQTHIINFDDENLKGAALGVAGGETRMKLWNVPTTPGEYRFSCNVPGHERRGEVGMMIVE